MIYDVLCMMYDVGTVNVVRIMTELGEMTANDARMNTHERKEGKARQALVCFDNIDGIGTHEHSESLKTTLRLVEKRLNRLKYTKLRLTKALSSLHINEHSSQSNAHTASHAISQTHTQTQTKTQTHTQTHTHTHAHTNSKTTDNKHTHTNTQTHKGVSFSNLNDKKSVAQLYVHNGPASNNKSNGNTTSLNEGLPHPLGVNTHTHTHTNTHTHTHTHTHKPHTPQRHGSARRKLRPLNAYDSERIQNDLTPRDNK